VSERRDVRRRLFRGVLRACLRRRRDVFIHGLPRRRVHMHRGRLPLEREAHALPQELPWDGRGDAVR
jgi:hypothetical protein